MRLLRLLPGASLALAVLLMVAIMMGCSESVPVVENQSLTTEDQRLVMVLGLLPDWGMDEMIEQSDAIASGLLERDLGVKVADGGAGDPPKYQYEFTNYVFEVEQDFYPGTLPEKIAVLAETGARPVKEGYTVIPHEGIPNYWVGEKVILFLVSLADEEKYGDGASRPVPDGYAVDDYYLTVVGGNFGKLVQSGGRWQDTRTGKSFTSDDLAEGIERIKKQ